MSSDIDIARAATPRHITEVATTLGIPQDAVFIPFAYTEAAANLLTNPALDPFGKIPEFKYCAIRITPGGEVTPASVTSARPGSTSFVHGVDLPPPGGHPAVDRAAGLRQRTAASHAAPCHG